MNTAPLIDLIKTESDRTIVLNLLDDLSQGIFKINEDRQKIIESDKIFGDALLASLSSDFIKTDPRLAQKEVEKLDSLVRSIPTIQIIVAVSPNNDTIAKLIEFVATKSTQKSVLDIKIHPDILGGAIFIINGRYIDLSVSNKLNKAFEKDQQNLNAILNSQ